MITSFEKITAIFFRDEGFYAVEFSGTKSPVEEAADHALLNAGTRRIEDTNGNVLWRCTCKHTEGVGTRHLGSCPQYDHAKDVK